MTARPGHARAAAAGVVAQVLQGRSLDAALETVLTKPDEREGALIQEMAYGAVRWTEGLQALVKRFLARPLKKKDVDLQALLLVGLYQLLHMRVPPHAAVSETVAATAGLDKPWAKGLVNGVLRRADREGREVLAALAAKSPAVAFSHPAWLLAALERDWPDAWQRVCEANNARPPMTLRVNTRRIAREEYIAKLRGNGLDVSPEAAAPSAVTLARPVPVTMLPGFEEGEASVQDAAAQWAGLLLDMESGLRVLDACAAPGGKAAHLLERAPGPIELIALDIDAGRLGRVRETLQRLGLQATLVAGDAAGPETWWDQRPFDRILVDAPCSGTGVIRRHPDIKLHRRPEDVARLAALQARILRALWPLLRPGGKLLYATCSILKVENEEQIERLRAEQPGVRLLDTPIPGAQRRPAGWQILPGEREMDGFFYAYLQKE